MLVSEGLGTSTSTAPSGILAKRKAAAGEQMLEAGGDVRARCEEALSLPQLATGLGWQPILPTRCDGRGEQAQKQGDKCICSTSGSQTVGVASHICRNL